MRNVGGGRGTVVEPSLRDISIAYNNIFPDGSVWKREFSKVPQARRCAACKTVLEPDFEQGGVAADDADRGRRAASPKLRHPYPDWR
jgi:hypothetical protein